MDQSSSLASEHQMIHDWYLEHHDWLQQWLSFRITDSFNAPDIVQDTFVKLLQTRQKLFGIQEPKAYLTNIAKNIVIDKHRRYVLEKTYLEALAIQQFEQESILAHNDLEKVVEILDFITLSLSHSTAIARKAFLMYYFEGYNQSEVAVAIGKSLRTTQSYLADCLSACFEAKQRLCVYEYD
ncbi:RNA polymerase sigma factor [Acinetobacter rathckeae]|uniref:RNA polymerase sigma factor n=1 Tax=Acinetobacter rathckeae TaxID=2605272 RepID=UPI0018A2AD37|nr:RNA polymerase sigma factor [Acinetobacter rathckeae]MBF7688548.1 RNA polymerase sigma factor [Acinetobacter rathckeae]